MPDTSGKQLSMDAAQNPDRKPAVRLAGVGKEYRLYKSFSDQALDVLGLSWMRFWKPLGYQTFTALNGIDLEIKHGERVGIVGRNGAGKTTLLKLITGNFAPTTGEIEINGDVQALMQTGLGFHGDFTGRENVKSSLIYNGLIGDELEAAAEDVIEFCELGEFFDQPVKTYSLGMRTRLQFACATAIKPDIVIIDEVLGAGDAYFSGKSNVRIRRLTNSGATLLIVSHSMQQILQFSNRVIWMDKGRVVADGKPLAIVNLYEESIHRHENKLAKASSTTLRNTLAPLKSENMADIPEWFLSKDGEEGSDWSGEGPLRIRKINVIDKDGNPVEVITPGQPFGIVAEVASDREGTYACSCLFVMYNEAGEVVTRLVEPQRDYIFDGDTHKVTAWFDANPIGHGEYLLSGGLYRDYRLIAPATSHRYHILSRARRLRVVSPARDNSRILLAPSWRATRCKPSTIPARETVTQASGQET